MLLAPSIQHLDECHKLARDNARITTLRNKALNSMLVSVRQHDSADMEERKLAFLEQAFPNLGRELNQEEDEWESDDEDEESDDGEAEEEDEDMDGQRAEEDDDAMMQS